MAIRLKEFKFSNWFRLLMVIIGISGVLIGFYGVLRYPDFSYGLRNDYRLVLEDEVAKVQSNIFLLNKYKSEENIKSGALIDEHELRDRIDMLKRERNYSIRKINRVYDALIAEQNNAAVAETQRLNTERDESIAIANRDHEKMAVEAREKLLTQDLARYNEAKSFLENYAGLYYSVVTNGVVTGPKPEYYSSLPFFKKINDNGEPVVYIGFSNDVVDKQAAQYETRHSNGLTGIYMLLSGMGLMLFSFAGLMFVAGRTPDGSEIQFNFLDSIYLDIGLLIGGTIAMVCGAGAGVMIVKAEKFQVADQVAIVALVFAYLTMAAYAMMFAKRFKSGEVFSHTLLYKAFITVKTSLATIMNTSIASALEIPTDYRTFAIKVALFLTLFAGAVGLNVLLFVFLVTALDAVLGMIVALGVFALLIMGVVNLLLKRITGFMVLADGIRKIKDGNLNHKIPLSGFTAVDAIADDINNIAYGVKAAVDREMRAEHMKVELITNVSHDLKTPLTSIITYSDLLAREDNGPEQVKEYAEILKRKSGHLKQLVDDLFEVSKAQSGTITAKLETLSLNDLITQTLAEYEDSFENAKLDVVLTIPQEKVMVLADGAKMWRVLSNIYNNAIKYSMSGTRVYVDAEVINGKARITVKNIANYIMRFETEEICERFKRGDESRSGEGSGLGLAIVKSFMALQNGNCDVVADGDLFKVMLSIPQS